MSIITERKGRFALSTIAVTALAIMAVPLRPALAEDAPQTAPAGNATPAHEDMSSFTLKNGLKVVVLPDHRAPVVTQMIYYKAGAADEPWGTSGIAHFLEHLMFKGTKKHPEGEFSRSVADIGGQENAFTTADYTGYYQQVPPDALKDVMSFEADRMENLVLTDDVLLPERQVILEERRMRIDNNPAAQLSEAVQAALFRNSPYGIPVIGWRKEMEKLSREDAIAFYDKFYTPNNATLLIVGDTTTEEVRKLAEETYGKVPRRADPGPRIRPQEPEPLASRTVTLTDPKVTQPVMQRTYLVPSDSTADGNEAVALDLLADILGGGTTSRLYRGLIVDNSIAAAAGAAYQGTALDSGQFVLYGMPRGRSTLQDVEDAIDGQVHDLLETGVTTDELERAKNRVRKNLVYLKDNQTAVARRYAAALSTGRTLQDVENWPDMIEKVTVADVNAAARKYLKPQRSVTGYLKPDASGASSADATEPSSAVAPTPPAAPTDTGTLPITGDTPSRS